MNIIIENYLIIFINYNFIYGQIEYKFYFFNNFIRKGDTMLYKRDIFYINFTKLFNFYELKKFNKKIVLFTGRNYTFKCKFSSLYFFVVTKYLLIDI